MGCYFGLASKRSHPRKRSHPLKRSHPRESGDLVEGCRDLQDSRFHGNDSVVRKGVILHKQLNPEAGNPNTEYPITEPFGDAS
jgi:hypothetical protein